MANRYWVGGTGTWDATATGKWSTTSGGSPGAAVPTAADDVYFDAASGAATITLSGARVCRSLNTTGFTGTFTGTSTLTIGTSTTNGTNALTVGASTTWSHTGTITFVSTNATQLDITTNGKTLSAFTFNGVGGSWRLVGASTLTGLITLTNGSLDINGVNLTCSGIASNSTNTRSLTLGAATLTLTGASPINFGNGTNLTFSGAAATINATATTTNFSGGGKAYGDVTFSGSAATSITGVNTFNVLTKAGGSQISFTGNQTVDTAVFTGESTVNRLFVRSANFGTSCTITSTNAWSSCANVDFQDIAAAGSGDADISAITGYSGDAGGNSGFTFTTPALQTLLYSAAGNWSSLPWSDRMPLPQDDWEITTAFSVSGQTITVDVPRIGRNGTWAGSSGSVTWNVSGATTIYGSLALRSGMTMSGSETITFNARSGSYTLTSANTVWTTGLTFFGIDADWSLSDDLFTIRPIVLSSGYNGVDSWTTNDHDVTCRTFTVGLGSAVNAGSSTFTLTETGSTTVWTVDSDPSTHFNAGTSNIVIGSVSANIRLFNGGSKTYHALTYTVPGSSGILFVLNGGSTFAITNFYDNAGGRNIGLADTITILTAAGMNWRGTPGNLTNVTSPNPGIPAYVNVPSGTVNLNYLSLQDIAASGSTPFYAGNNSVDNGGNLGWEFSNRPNTGGAGMLSMFG